jgi:transposase
MPNHAAAALVLREGDQDELVRWARASRGPAALATRARIVLAASEGQANARIAVRVGVSVPTVRAWRSRYESQGLEGLHDEARSGRPREVDRLEVITVTLTAPPKKYGITHWSTRLLGAHLGISDHTVAETWREYGVQPWRTGSFRFSTDPQLEAKVVDVVGLYLNPPENAVVLSIDEKSQIQALDRTAPVLAMQPHLIERRSHDYIRHGTSTLFAALDVATGKITGRMADRHRHQEFLTFLCQIARAYPDQELHLIMDNYAAHKHANVKAWLGQNPRIHVHFTPTHASWMNMVECWFSMAERQAIHRGTYRSVRDLNAKIRAYIDGWNDRAHPFTWTKTATEILAKANRKKTSPAEH